jgi:hypothetical protein
VCLLVLVRAGWPCTRGHFVGDGDVLMSPHHATRPEEPPLLGQEICLGLVDSERVLHSPQVVRNLGFKVFAQRVLANKRKLKLASVARRGLEWHDQASRIEPHSDFVLALQRIPHDGRG